MQSSSDSTPSTKEQTKQEWRALKKDLIEHALVLRDLLTDNQRNGCHSWRIEAMSSAYDRHFTKIWQRMKTLEEENKALNQRVEKLEKELGLLKSFLKWSANNKG